MDVILDHEIGLTYNQAVATAESRDESGAVRDSIDDLAYDVAGILLEEDQNADAAIVAGVLFILGVARPEVLVKLHERLC